VADGHGRCRTGSELQRFQPGQLKLTGKLLADIYLGKITKWNDPAIASLNPGLNLPDQAIAPVYRSDGSGTTFIFTHYLSEVSPEWKEKIGESTAVQFPIGLGGKRERRRVSDGEPHQRRYRVC
jgi:phosphate transport system substrate-binding protein